MARTVTIDSYDSNTGDVTFTVAGAIPVALNRTYKVNNMPVDSKDILLTAIRFYLRAYRDGAIAARRATADNSVTTIVGQPQAETDD